MHAVNVDEHLDAIINVFFAAERRDRYLGLAHSPRGRGKLRQALAHFQALDPRYARRLSSAEQSVETIEQLLRGHGAPATCYVIAESRLLDGRVLPLGEALTAVVGRGSGAVVSCIPGRLAYYEGEDPDERYLLERPPRPPRGQ